MMQKTRQKSPFSPGESSSRTTKIVLVLICQFLDASDLGEGRCHGADTEGADSLGMLGKLLRRTHTSAAYVNDDLEVFGLDERLGQEHRFLFLDQPMQGKCRYPLD